MTSISDLSGNFVMPWNDMKNPRVSSTNLAGSEDHSDRSGATSPVADIKID
jgi:hypothetical protein